MRGHRSLETRSAWIIFTFMAFLPLFLSAQIRMADEDKTLSPYFYIHSDDPATEALPLRSTSAEVSIAGVIADVTVTQEYKNEGRKPIEAVYVFPASTRAAVYSMVMTIGERVIVARIEEKDRARQQYEEAKDAGQSASLLEQERPNLFTMNVANIMPGDLIKVELKYTELLVPQDKVYRGNAGTLIHTPWQGSNPCTAVTSTLGYKQACPYRTSGYPPTRPGSSTRASPKLRSPWIKVRSPEATGTSSWNTGWPGI